jgi:hypothetical protein
METQEFVFEEGSEPRLYEMSLNSIKKNRL